MVGDGLAKPKSSAKGRKPARHRTPAEMRGLPSFAEVEAAARKGDRDARKALAEFVEQARQVTVPAEIQKLLAAGRETPIPEWRKKIADWDVPDVLEMLRASKVAAKRGPSRASATDELILRLAQFKVEGRGSHSLAESYRPDLPRTKALRWLRTFRNKHKDEIVNKVEALKASPEKSKPVTRH